MSALPPEPPSFFRVKFLGHTVSIPSPPHTWVTSLFSHPWENAEVSRRNVTDKTNGHFQSHRTGLLQGVHWADWPSAHGISLWFSLNSSDLSSPGLYPSRVQTLSQSPLCTHSPGVTLALLGVYSVISFLTTPHSIGISDLSPEFYSGDV